MPQERENPSGSPLSPHVGRMIFRMAEELATHRADEVRRLLLSPKEGGEGLFFKDAAKRLIPGSCAVNIKIASDVVSQAARMVLTAEEDDAVRKRNTQTRQHVAGSMSDNTNALAAQEKSTWSPAERARLRRLAGSARYQHKSGPHKGKPNVSAITDILNEKLKEDRPARTIVAVRSEIGHLLRGQGAVPPVRINWKVVRPELLRLAGQKEYLYPPGSDHPGQPNWNIIAAILSVMFPEQPQITPKNCSMQYNREIDK